MPPSSNISCCVSVLAVFSLRLLRMRRMPPNTTTSESASAPNIQVVGTVSAGWGGGVAPSVVSGEGHEDGQFPYFYFYSGSDRHVVGSGIRGGDSGGNGRGAARREKGMGNAQFQRRTSNGSRRKTTYCNRILPTLKEASRKIGFWLDVSGRVVHVACERRRQCYAGSLFLRLLGLKIATGVSGPSSIAAVQQPDPGACNGSWHVIIVE